MSCAFVGAVVLCPRELTRSLGFWNSGVLKSGEGVSSGDTLASSPERVDVALLSNEPVVSVKNTLFIDNCGGPGRGSFFFIALDRLKIDVGESVMSSSSEWLECSSPAATHFIVDLARTAA